MTEPFLCIGGPRDGMRISLPEVRDSFVAPEKRFLAFDGPLTVTYRHFALWPGPVIVYIVEYMSPDDAIRALVERYPSENPKP